MTWSPDPRVEVPAVVAGLLNALGLETWLRRRCREIGVDVPRDLIADCQAARAYVESEHLGREQAAQRAAEAHASGVEVSIPMAMELVDLYGDVVSPPVKQATVTGWRKRVRKGNWEGRRDGPAWVLTDRRLRPLLDEYESDRWFIEVIKRDWPGDSP